MKFNNRRALFYFLTLNVEYWVFSKSVMLQTKSNKYQKYCHNNFEKFVFETLWNGSSINAFCKLGEGFDVLCASWIAARTEILS